MRTFENWFEENKAALEPMLRGDAEEALYAAWIAGYGAGGDAIARTLSVASSWDTSPDRSGGQFTDEEIRESERGGHGW